MADNHIDPVDAPICLTWDLTYVRGLSGIDCLPSSGRHDPRELTTAQRRRSCRSTAD